jgi:Spy/CpxP family protein refolding chaperone
MIKQRAGSPSHTRIKKSNMKKIFLSVFAAALLVGVSQAQDSPEKKPRQHEAGRYHHRGENFKSLNLTAEQQTQLKALREENRKKMAKLKKNDNITVKEWKTKMSAQRAEQKAKFESILTTEQKAQLQKQREERKSHFGERSGRRMDRIKADLNLSDDQSARLKAKRESMSAKMKSLREDKSLSDEDRKTQTKALMQKQKEEMKSILTEEQIKKLEERQRERPQRKKSA